MVNRFFVALPLPDDVRRKLIEVQADIIGRLDAPLIRMVKEENLHITLHFLGNQPDVEPILASVQTVESGTFEVELRGCGYFPSVRRPRVFWIGVGDGATEVGGLHADIAAALRSRGLPVEERRFRPHVTLGYVRKNLRSSETRSLPQVTGRLVDSSIARFTARRVVVMNSETRPDGSVYTEMGERRMDDSQ